MSIATEVLDDAQLAESVALAAIDLVLRIMGPEKASAALSAAAIARANAAANAVADAKFGPEESK